MPADSRAHMRLECQWAADIFSMKTRSMLSSGLISTWKRLTRSAKRSVDSLSTRTARASAPWRVELREELRFPISEVGPFDFAPLSRLAARRFSEIGIRG